MDFLALFAAGKILGLQLKPLRLILSSTLGALYCIFTFTYDSVIPEIIINVLVSVVMCFIAYNISSLVRFTKIFVIFYSACFMLGGGIEALYYLSGLVKTDDMHSGQNLNITSSTSVSTIIIFAGLCTLIIIFTGTLFKRRASIENTEIIIGFMNKEVKVDAIVDSGNLLCEPISSLPVIVVNLNSVLDLLDIDTIGFFAGDSIAYLNSTSNDNKLELVKALKFRIVPVKSVAGSESILPAFSPDYIKYKSKGKKFIGVNAIIAVDGKNAGTYGEKYGGIVPSALIEL